MRTYKSILVFALILAIRFAAINKLPAQISGDLPHGMPAGIPVPGYVILTTGDTLYGKIKWAMKYVENNPVEIKFTAENGASKSFNVNEINGFGMQFQIMTDNGLQPVLTEMENYIRIPSFKKNVPVFMNRLLDGRIKIYQNRSANVRDESVSETKITGINGITFSYSPEEGLFIGPALVRETRIIMERSYSSSYFVVKDDSSMIKVEKGNYESVFKILFGDCPGIDQELTKNPDLIKFKNFYILSEVYNRICN